MECSGGTLQRLGASPSGLSRALSSAQMLLLVTVMAALLPLDRAYQDIEFEWATDRRYNPSLVEAGDLYMSALKLTTFRKAKQKTIWVNTLYLCRGNKANIQKMRCPVYNPWSNEYLECEFDKRVRNGKLDTSGLGDVKIWKWPGKGVYAIFGRKPERTEDPLCSDKVVYYQWIAQVRAEMAASDEWYLQAPLRLHVSNYTYSEKAPYVMEKNWMPFVWKDPSGKEQLLATYMVQPHRVVHVQRSGESILKWTTSDDKLFSKFKHFDVHGGPPIVYVPPKLSGSGKPYYLGIMHHIERFDKGKIRLYRHFAFKFEPQPPFKIQAISDELSLRFHKDTSRARTAWVAYVAGLYMTENGTLYITYGAGDLKSRALILHVRELERNFTGRIAFLPHKVPFDPVPPEERRALL